MKNLYLNNLHYGDHLVEGILQDLKKMGIFENSLIIITADHGEAFAEHDAIKHNRTVYEEMIRIPMIIKMPGIESTTIDRHVGLEDLFATINELYGLEHDLPALRSNSLLPFIAGDKNARSRDWYYRRSADGFIFYSIRGNQYKYSNIKHHDHLFDLLADPAEQINIADKKPVLTSYLRTMAELIIITDTKLNSVWGVISIMMRALMMI